MISAGVLDSTDKLRMECVLETKAAPVFQFLQGLRGSLHVTFEEGTCAAWLRDLLNPTVQKHWRAIRGKMCCSKPGTGMTGSMLESWPTRSGQAKRIRSG
jgi:hypothetical protein